MPVMISRPDGTMPAAGIDGGDVVADEDGDGDAAEAGVGDAFGNEGHSGGRTT